MGFVTKLGKYSLTLQQLKSISFYCILIRNSQTRDRGLCAVKARVCCIMQAWFHYPPCVLLGALEPFTIVRFETVSPSCILLGGIPNETYQTTVTLGRVGLYNFDPALHETGTDY